jgi:hypothetical protein
MLGLTHVLCSPVLAELERSYLGALGLVEHFETRSDELRLVGPNVDLRYERHHP